MIGPILSVNKSENGRRTDGGTGRSTSSSQSLIDMDSTSMRGGEGAERLAEQAELGKRLDLSESHINPRVKRKYN